MSHLYLLLTITLVAAPTDPPAGPADPPAARPAPAPKVAARPLARPALRPLATESVTFAKILRLALKHNRDLARAGLDLASARLDVQAARGEYDPRLNAGLKYQRATSSPVESLNIQTLRSSTLEYSLSASQKLPTGGTVALGLVTSRSTALTRFNFSGAEFENESKSWDTSLALSVSHPLLKGVGIDRNLAAIRQARLARDARRWAARAKAEAVVRDLWKAYLDVVDAEAAVRVQKEGLSQAERDLSRAEALLDAGRLAPSDLIDYRFAVAQQSRALLEARTAWLQQSLALRVAMGIKIRPDQRLLSAALPGSPFGQRTPTEKEAAEGALRHSRDLLAALKELQIKRISLVTARRDRLPQLDLTASVGPQGRADSIGKAHEIMFKFKSIGWSVGLTFTYLIGSRAARAARDKAELDIRRQEVTIDELRQVLVSEATRAVALFRLEEKLAKTAALEHQLAVVRLQNERKKYAVGRSTLFVILQLTNEAIRTRHKAFSARIACLKRRAELAALMGDLLPRLRLKATAIQSLRLGKR